MKVIEIEKRKTWPERLTGLEVGEKLNVSMQHASTVRSIISRFKYSPNPNHKFTTVKKTQKGVDFIQVERIE